MNKQENLQELTREELTNISGGTDALEILFALSPFGPAYWLGYQLGKALS